MSKTEKSAPQRPDRPIPTNRENVGHIVVESDGVKSPDTTVSQFTRKHELMDKEINKGDAKRVIKNDNVGERHHVQEDGLVTAKRREASVLKNRAESAKCFDSKRKSVSRQG
jgi:hypothetical protein